MGLDACAICVVEESGPLSRKRERRTRKKKDNDADSKWGSSEGKREEMDKPCHRVFSAYGGCVIERGSFVCSNE